MAANPYTPYSALGLPPELLLFLMQQRQRQEQQSQAGEKLAGKGLSKAIKAAGVGGGGGAGAYYGLGGSSAIGGGTSGITGGTSAITGGTSAISGGTSAAGGGAGSTLASAALPAAFIAAAPLYTPGVAKLGDAVGRLLGIGKGVNIPYNPEEAGKSDYVNKSLPGFENVDQGKRQDFLNRAAQAGLLAPRSKGQGAGYNWEISAARSPDATLLRQDPFEMGRRANAGTSMKFSSVPENALNWLDAPAHLRDKKLGGFLEEAKRLIAEAGQGQQAPAAIPQFAAGANIDPGFNLRQPIPQGAPSVINLIPRSSTRSPGIDKSGKRIKY